MKIKFVVLSMVLVFSLMFGFSSVATAKDYVSKKVPSDLILVGAFLDGKVLTNKVNKRNYDVAVSGKFKISEGNYRVYYMVIHKGHKRGIKSRNFRRLDTNIWIFNEIMIVRDIPQKN